MVNLKIVVTYGVNITEKKHKETFWIAGNVLCLDLDGG